MNKIATLFLLAAIPLMGQEGSVPERTPQTGDVAGFASRDATVLSVVGWGVSIAVGIATIAALIDNDHAHSD